MHGPLNVKLVNLCFDNFNHFIYDKLYIVCFQWGNVSSSSSSIVNSAMFFQELKLLKLKRGPHLTFWHRSFTFKF
jgi:hypothetical protein